MKSHYKLLLPVLVMFALKTSAQAPQAIPYQAVARNSGGNIIANQNVSLRFTIHDATAGGTIVYKETQSKTTNSLGLFTANIGQGTVVTGTFAVINWGSGSKFLQVEMDASGGITYVDMGTQQMLSVPYALYAAGAWSIKGNNGTVDGVNYIGTTDNVPFSIMVNNQRAGKIDNNLHNAAFGYECLRSVTNGFGLTAFGDSALYSTTSSFWNTAIGDRTLRNNSSGYSNTAIGTQALYSNTVGYNNTSNGFQALNSNSAGYQNTALGVVSLFKNSTGFNNTANGHGALNQNTIGSSNTALGMNSLFFNTTGYSNIAVGINALYHNTIQNNIVAIGDSALFNNGLGGGGGGNANTAVGSKALFTNNSGGSNTSIGYYSLYSNSAGYSNTACGTIALSSNNTGFENTAIGTASLANNHSGQNNCGIGSSALFLNDNGSNNTGIGYQALASNSSGSYNSALGYYADVASSSLSNSTAIGYRAFVSANNSLVLGSINGINSSTANVNVGIGTTAPSALLSIGAIGTELGGTAASNSLRTNAGVLGSSNGSNLKLASFGFTSTNNTSLGIMAYRNGVGSDYHSSVIVLGMDVDNLNQAGGAYLAISNNGNIGIGTAAPTQALHVVGNGLFTGTVTASCGTLSCSDIRYKKSITPLQHSLDKICLLNGVNYFWKKDKYPEMNFNDDKQIGVIAQELEKVFPELVHTDAKGYKTVDYTKLTPVLIEAIKELKSENENLKSENISFKEDIEKIKVQLGMETKAEK